MATFDLTWLHNISVWCFLLPKLDGCVPWLVVLGGAWLTRILQAMSSQLCRSRACHWKLRSICVPPKALPNHLQPCEDFEVVPGRSQWPIFHFESDDNGRLAVKLNQWISNLPQWTTASMFCRPAESLCPSWQPDSKANHDIETTGEEAKQNPSARPPCLDIPTLLKGESQFGVYVFTSSIYLGCHC